MEVIFRVTSLGDKGECVWGGRNMEVHKLQETLWQDDIGNYEERKISFKNKGNLERLSGFGH